MAEGDEGDRGMRLPFTLTLVPSLSLPLRFTQGQGFGSGLASPPVKGEELDTKQLSLPWREGVRGRGNKRLKR
jgi:hypothetical protein